MKKIGSRGCGEFAGYVLTTCGGGVLNFQDTVSARASPLVDLIPAGTVTVYSVALGSRSINSESYSKARVFVPSQRQVPAREGSILTGTSCSARSLSVPMGTIG